MKISPAKENILKKIRKALIHPTPLPFPQSEGHSSVFRPVQQELEIEFAEQFSKLQDKLKTHLSKNTDANFSDEDLGGCEAAVTSCELLIARTGSIVMSSFQQSG